MELPALALEGRSANIPPVNVTSREFKACAVEFFAQLRREAPVFHIVLPDGQQAWLVARYDDVEQLLKDDRFSKDFHTFFQAHPERKMPWIPGALAPLMHHMLDTDPPDHTRLRALVQKAFKPSLVEGLRSRIEELSERLLRDAKKSNSIDLIKQFALPIPSTIIAEMLGVPVKDRYKFQKWSKSMMEAGSARFRLLRVLPTAWLFSRYLRRLIKSKRANPQEDLLTGLVQVEEGGQRLSEDELLSMIFLLLIAGHETTTNLIGNGTLALVENSDQMQRLRNEPTLMKSAIEELLRFTSPVELATERYAKEDVTIAGLTIPRGSLVLAAIASANRDEQHFANPDQLDLSREPNKHLSFGLGPHYCLGAPLARLEAQIAFTALLRHTADIDLAVPTNKLRWRRGIILRGLESLPLTVEWR